MERVSRRQLLAAGGSAALASAVIGSGVAAAQGTRPTGQPVDAWIERYILVLDAAKAGSARPATTGGGAPTGPSYATGTVYADSAASGGAVASGAAAVGSFKIGSWVYAGGASPQMVGFGAFDIAGRGKFTLTGAGGWVGNYAVSGGTGDFGGVGGEGRTASLAPGNQTTYILEVNFIGHSTGK